MDAKELYQRSTGRNPNRAPRRIAFLEEFMKRCDGEVIVFDDPNKPRRDYRNGIVWLPGKQIGDTIMLGYTNSQRHGYTISAVFAKCEGGCDVSD